MIAEVILWGKRIAVVSQDENQSFATFQYEPGFSKSGIQVSPLMMPLRDDPYEFPALPFQTFHGLPGLLADSLPDRFGNALIDAWLAREGRPPESFSILEKLCYIGERGMGALEFKPVTGPKLNKTSSLQISHLVDLANQVLDERSGFIANFSPCSKTNSIADILRVGTSAGGARAKAVIAWNPKTNEVRSGQVKTESEFEYWLLKFDGIRDNQDKELADPKGFGAIEYAYSLMAKEVGIQMTDCRLFEENGRRHFTAKRFDRLAEGGKLHMQSLCGIAHYDFNQAGAYSYEQAMMAMRTLKLNKSEVEEQFRRAAFNIVARNQDDHVKNIAFLMDRNGGWTLSPAYDLTYSYNPEGDWTSAHQMTLNGKRDNFLREDIMACAKAGGINRQDAVRIFERVLQVVSQWNTFAAEAKVSDSTAAKIGRTHRLTI